MSSSWTYGRRLLIQSSPSLGRDFPDMLESFARLFNDCIGDAFPLRLAHLFTDCCFDENLRLLLRSLRTGLPMK